MLKLTKTKTDLMLAVTGDLGQKLVGYVVLVVLARYLAKEAMGDFFFATAVTSVAILFAELGTGQYLVRQTAQEPDKALRRLGEVMSLRAPLLVLVFLGLLAVIAVVKPQVLPVVALAAGYLLLNDFYYSFGAFLVGQREVWLRVATAMGGQLLSVTLILGAVWLRWDLLAILGCYVVSNTLLLAGTWLAVRLRHGPVRLSWNAAAMADFRRILSLSVPLFILTMLGMLHMKMGTILLGLLPSRVAEDPSVEVARYEVAYKLYEVSRFMVRPMTLVFLPICAALATQQAWGRLSHKFKRLVLGGGGMGLAMALGVAVAAPWVIPLLFGHQYDDSIGVLRVLFLSVPALYVGFIATFVANAMHLERRAAVVFLAVLALDLGINVCVIPRFGALGAAWTMMATESLLALGLTILVGWRLRQRALSSKAAFRCDADAPAALGAAEPVGGAAP